MRYLPTKKTVRRLFAAEGYLELELPERAIQELDRVEEAGVLDPYASFLRGQALRRLERYEEAINPLHAAARSIPAPWNQLAWRDLSDCFRHEGCHELAEIVEMFADNPTDADGDFIEPNLDEFLHGLGAGVRHGGGPNDFGDRQSAPVDDFAQFNFDGDADDSAFHRDDSSHRNRPQK